MGSSLQRNPERQLMNFLLEKTLAARLAKTLAATCVRHTGIEEIHKKQRAIAVN